MNGIEMILADDLFELERNIKNWLTANNAVPLSTSIIKDGWTYGAFVTYSQENNDEEM